MIPPTVCEVKCAATQALIALIEEPLPAVCAAALEPAVALVPAAESAPEAELLAAAPPEPPVPPAMK